ncbi:acyl-CoA thioesterase [candidate division KSB1 bacterium]|nr:acyl-CoA thioesterase [candidate division KSB1 bacterium]
MSSNNYKSKPMSNSKVEMTEMVLPGDTNSQGNIFGGKVMQLIDIAASVAALRHCRKPVNTVNIDQLDFKKPIKMGHIVVLYAQVEYVGITSMEIGVEVFSENPLTGERIKTTVAHLVFVALDENGKPTKVEQVVPESDDEKRRYQEAKQRREARRKQILNKGAV